MSVLADLLLGTGLTAVFWGYVCAAFLEAFGIAGTTPWVFIASGVSFAWGIWVGSSHPESRPRAP